MLRRLFLLLWYAAAGLVIGLALLISLVRLSLPLLDSYRHQLEDWIEEQTGQPVSVGRLDVGWYRLGPRVRLLDARLLDPAGHHPVLAVRELSIGLELWPLLRDRQPVVSGLVVSGAEVSLVRLRDGRVVLEGFEDRPRGARSPLSVVLAQPRIEFEDIGIRLSDQTGVFPPWHFQQLDALLLNRGERHQFNGEVELPAEFGRRMALGADLRGRSDAPQSWRGRLYFAAEGLPLRTWLKPLKPHSMRFGGLLDTEIWVDFGGGALQRLTAELAVDLPEISHTRETLPLFSAARFDTRLEWRARPGGWTLELGRTHLAWVDREWPEDRLSLSLQRDEDGVETLSVGLGYFELAPFRRLFARLAPLDGQVKAVLSGLEPRGQLRNFRLTLMRDGGRVSAMAFETAFEDLGVSGWQRWPGISGLSGRLRGTLEGGELILDSRPVRFIQPAVFRSSLSLDRLQGTLRWRQGKEGLRLESNGLWAANADLATVSRLRLDFPAGGGAPFLDMQTLFRQGDVGAVGRYLPARIMNPVAVGWLDRALVSGDITSGGFLFRGHPADFPFKGGEGRMEVRVNVSDAVLDYHPDWHRIEEIEAEVAFINDRMLIRAASARILGTKLSDVEVGIADLRHSPLDIRGHVQGPLGDMLRFVRESPLSRRGYPVETLAGRGDAELDLKIRLPFRKHHAPDSLRVRGALRLAGNGLRLKDWGLDFEALQGTVQISEAGIATESLAGRLLGAPVRLRIGEAGTGGERRIQASLTGPLPLVQQLQQQPLALWRRLDGTAQWRLTVDVQPRTAERPGIIDLNLESDLRGIRVALPRPFGKAVDEARPFRLRTRLQQGGGSTGPLFLEYGPHSAALVLGKKNDHVVLERATILANRAPAPLPDAPGIHIGGQLEEFDLDGWKPLFPATGGGDGAAELLRSVELKLGRLQAYGQYCEQVDLKAARLPEGWRIALAGPDLSGNVFVPQPLVSGKVRVDMNRLFLKAADGAGGLAAVRHLVPTDLPALSFEAASLRLRQYDFGRVAMEASPMPEGLRIEHMEIAADWLAAAGSGEWVETAEGQVSRFQVEITDGSLGGLLKTFGYEGQIEGGRLRGRIQANWAGSPADFDLARLEGSLELHIGKGMLVKVEPGAGRMLGLLSLEALPRRLVLDFSDLFKEGFAFDRIEGHFTLMGGDAFTNDLLIEGPSAHIEIAGRTGLAARDYDELVTVTPKVGAGLPIAGALAGGPAVGAALLIADQLLGEPLGQMARYQYRVQGSWDDPVFTRLKPESAAGVEETGGESAQ